MDFRIQDTLAVREAALSPEGATIPRLRLTGMVVAGGLCVR